MSNILSEIIQSSQRFCLSDAPIDGNEYVRRNGFWSKVKNTIIKNGNVTIEGNKTILDLSSGNIFLITFTQDTTIEVSNLNNVLSEGESYIANLKLINAGNYNIVWPTNFKWAGGIGIPSFTSSGMDEVSIIFYSDNDISVSYSLDIK